MKTCVLGSLRSALCLTPCLAIWFAVMLPLRAPAQNVVTPLPELTVADPAWTRDACARQE